MRLHIINQRNVYYIWHMLPAAIIRTLHCVILLQLKDLSQGYLWSSALYQLAILYVADQFPQGPFVRSFLSVQSKDQWENLLTQIKWMKKVIREAVSLLWGLVIGNSWITLKARLMHLTYVEWIWDVCTEGPMRRYQGLERTQSCSVKQWSWG